MAIRFTKDYNREINRVVRNYNQTRNRAIKRGFTHLPQHILVSELKARYKTREDLNRELNYLRSFSANKKKLLRQVETSGGFNAVSWELEYIKNNLENTKDYFRREYERASKRVSKFPGERQYLDTIQAKLDNLELDIDYMDQKQFRSALSSVNEFAKSQTRLKSQYRGFMKEVELVMERVGIDKTYRDQFFNKFSKLTPTQFLFAYDNNDLISRVYGLYFKREGASDWSLNVDAESAEDIINTLLEEAEDIVKDAQTNAD